jgi:RNA polymerase sigma factor (TIGR02999 family)
MEPKPATPQPESPGTENPLPADQLLPQVYDELRRLAAYRLACERPGQTLQATALVHEAWLRLANAPTGPWTSKAHFFSAAAETMRRILIDRARRKHNQRSGGQWQRVELEAVEIPAPSDGEELLALHEALEELDREDPPVAELVKLRFFLGLSHQQAAEVLGLNRSAADRQWVYARAWLYERIHGQDN